MKARFRVTGTSVLVLAVAVPHASLAQVAASHQATESHDFAIPAQPLATAVLVFSEQAGIQLVVGSDVTGDASADAVNGRMTVAVALDRLLAGTGLGWRYLGPRTVTIERRVAAAAPPPPVPAPSAMRTFAPLRIESERDPLLRSPGGSSDVTATEGTGSLAAVAASVASKIPTPLIDTPQSVSVLTSERLAQQNLEDTGSALQQMPGVAARMVDGVTGFTFLSRGFEVTTFSFDGGGPTFYQSRLDADVGTMLDTPELAEFDHIEVLRGSAGLFGGLAYPGGVINLQRKRPLDHQQLIVDLQAGSWNNRRIKIDATAPIAFDGRLRARVVGVAQDRDFFYDVTRERRRFIYGTLEADIGPDILVRVGGSYRDLRRPGFNASGLPRYQDGGDIGLPRATCLCRPWNHYAARQDEQFFAAEWRVGGSWRITANGTRRSQATDYLAGSVTVSAEQGAAFDAFLFRSGFSGQVTSTTGDISASGDIALGRTRIALTIGSDFASNAATTSGGGYHYGEVVSDDLVNDVLPRLDQLGVPLDGFDIEGHHVRARQYAPYLNISASPVKDVTVQAGVRKSYYAGRSNDTAGITTRGAQFAFRSSPQITASISYEPNDSLRLYTSYSDISQPQVLGGYGPDPSTVPPLSGKTVEGGLRWQNPRRNFTLSAAVYRQILSNLVIYGLRGATEFTCCYVVAPSARGYGLDLEAAGEILPGWQVQASYNWNRTSYRNDTDTMPLQSQQPAHQFKLWTSHVFPAGQRRWSIGGGIRLESKRYSIGEICEERLNATAFCQPANRPETLFPYTFAQPLYAVADLRLSRRIGSRLEAAVNITNITDARYYTTVAPPASGNYYGEPRAFMVSLKAKLPGFGGD